MELLETRLREIDGVSGEENVAFHLRQEFVDTRADDTGMGARPVELGEFLAAKAKARGLAAGSRAVATEAGPRSCRHSSDRPQARSEPHGLPSSCSHPTTRAERQGPQRA